MSRCLVLAWLACLAAILVQLSAPFEIVPARDEASSTLSCTACALILRDVSIFLRHAPRATLDDIARARDGDVDVDFKARLRASGLSRRRAARANGDDACDETDGVFEQEIDAAAMRSIERACAPERAQRYDRRYTWLGDAYYVDDESIPPSGPRGRIDPALAHPMTSLAHTASVSARASSDGARTMASRTSSERFINRRHARASAGSTRPRGPEGGIDSSST